MAIRDAQPGDASALALIYNQGIEDRLATLETEERTAEERRAWLEARGPRHPVIVAENAGCVIGFGSLNVFNPRKAYDHVADFSLYVERSWRNKGIGGRILQALIERARQLGYHKMVLSAFPFNAAGLALYLLTWADSIALLTDGREPAFTPEAAQVLADEHIVVHGEKILRLDAPAGHLRRIELEGGAAVQAEALFFHLGVTPGSDIGARLGCRLDEHGHLAVDPSQETSVKGVFAAGDLTGPPFLASSAAASGVRAALSLHRSLLPDRWRL